MSAVVAVGSNRSGMLPRRRSQRHAARPTLQICLAPVALAVGVLVWGHTFACGIGRGGSVHGARRCAVGGIEYRPRLAALHAAASVDVAQVTTEVRGEEGTTSFRRFFKDANGNDISPWHDLPLAAGSPESGEFWMVTEITKMTKPKMEIATNEPSNPIAQDVKKGNLRDYHGPIFWNYGYLPQTWEDPKFEHPELKVLGDNDPVDVVEIGSKENKQGEISKVKVLGVLAMIDDGELDWKLIAINSDDPLAPSLNDVSDVEKHMPGVISGIREWFRWYKTPDGKPLNGFGFDEKALGRETALHVVEETHGAWLRLRESRGSGTKLWTGSD